MGDARIAFGSRSLGGRLVLAPPKSSCHIGAQRWRPKRAKRAVRPARRALTCVPSKGPRQTKSSPSTQRRLGTLTKLRYPHEAARLSRSLPLAVDLCRDGARRGARLFRAELHDGSTAYE